MKTAKTQGGDARGCLCGLLLILAAALLLPGCAAEAPPRPPRLQVPERVHDLAVKQVGRALVLSFTLPRRSTDGHALTKPLEVEIFRQVSGGATAPAAPAKPWVSIEPQELGRFRHGPTVTYLDVISNFAQSVGSEFSFNVVTLTRGFRSHPYKSDLSNRAKVELLNVSPPVQNMIARQIPFAVALGWTAPTAGIAHGLPQSALTAYRIYRSESSHPGVFTLAGESSAATYRDHHFHFGRTYIYRVRAVFSQNGTTAASANSAPVEITPRQIFPPPAPGGLTAVYTGRSVELIWRPSVVPHLAGYNVYRKEPGGAAKRLNPHLLRTPAFADRAIVQGRKYIYWVTAVDTARNESTPSAFAIAETR